MIIFMNEQIVEDLKIIQEKEPDAYKAVEMVIRHIAGTYSDKYEVKEDTVIDTKKMLYNAKMGKYINIYQVNRYLQRVLSEGKKKSDLLNDIFKAIHYLVFEITRRIKQGEIDNTEYKV